MHEVQKIHEISVESVESVNTAPQSSTIDVEAPNNSHNKIQQRFNIISPRLSYWINIQRCWMCMIVLVSHITPYSVQIGKFDPFPHPFSSNGRATVRLFFVFSSFFTMNSIKPILTLNSFKQFVLQFSYFYIKRYFHSRAILFVFGLGYAPFLYFFFGENGRVTYHSHTAEFWKVWFLPFYSGRPSLTQTVSGSAWFSQQLFNVETVYFVLICILFVIRCLWQKIFSNRTKNKITKDNYYNIFVILVVFTAISNRINAHCDFMNEYCFGVWCYWLREWICKDKRIVQFAYCKTKINIVIRYIISCACIYTWLTMCRKKGWTQKYAHIPYGIFIMLDFVPFPRFNSFWQKIIDEISRLLMPIYIVHHPFLREAAPKYFPYLSAYHWQVEYNDNWLNLFAAWIYLLIFVMLSYPLWFIQRPLEMFPVWIKSIVDKKYLVKTKQFIKDIILSTIGLSITAILISLAQLDYFGHDFVDLPNPWK
ncbi:Conserved_hypothetical protein [Hexamita inflata]|uniref:Uncharacterized protein n=1 Tax=Hexamita inflata TaxID=28002 RepID=A0AA86PSZ1_9EUKA|nr:Conserved hypothetical protein [Hexamita inflata]